MEYYSPNDISEKDEIMAKTIFLKGPKLFSLARKKALILDIPQEKGVKLAELISRIQLKEGNESCFKQKDTCFELPCCWQASCGAKMTSAEEE